jgi:hypothetical protein
MDKGETKSYVLKVHRNIYGQKQASRVWNKYLVNKLTKEVGFVQSQVDKCVFYKGKMMYTLYTDNSILAAPDLKEIDDIIKQMQAANLAMKQKQLVLVPNYLEVYQGYGEARSTSKEHAFDWFLKNHNMS